VGLCIGRCPSVAARASLAPKLFLTTAMAPPPRFPLQQQPKKVPRHPALQEHEGAARQEGGGGGGQEEAGLGGWGHVRRRLAGADEGGAEAGGGALRGAERDDQAGAVPRRGFRCGRRLRACGFCGALLEPGWSSAGRPMRGLFTVPCPPPIHFCWLQLPPSWSACRSAEPTHMPSPPPLGFLRPQAMPPWTVQSSSPPPPPCSPACRARSRLRATPR
jgi:hypothetical protein